MNNSNQNKTEALKKLQQRVIDNIRASRYPDMKCYAQQRIIENLKKSKNK